VPARPCPVCGKGMFRPKALWRHLVLHHPDEAYRRGYRRQTGAEVARKTEAKRRKRKKRGRR